MQEYQAENNFYEQMCGHKRLRQQHAKGEMKMNYETKVQLQFRIEPTRGTI